MLTEPEHDRLNRLAEHPELMTGLDRGTLRAWSDRADGDDRWTIARLLGEPTPATHPGTAALERGRARAAAESIDGYTPRGRVAYLPGPGPTITFK